MGNHFVKTEENKGNKAENKIEKNASAFERFKGAVFDSPYTFRGENQGKINPMLLSPVIENVLKFLPLEDIKNCRLISKEWDSVAKPMMRNLSKIRFCKCDFRIGYECRNPANFFERFAETLDSLPFTSFEISSCNYRGWSVKELNNFFERQKGRIRKLAFVNIYLMDENNVFVPNFDIVHWISNSEMTKANTKYDTRLSIRTSGSYIQSTFLMLSLESLVNIKDVRLSLCKVNIQDNIRISPTTLIFRQVMFYRDGEHLSNILVNDFVDFSKAKSIAMRTCMRHGGDYTITSLTLDLHGNPNVNLESLVLSNINVISWRSSRWSAVQLIMHGIPFAQKTEMKILSCELHSCSPIDIFALPQSIKYLSIRNDEPEESNLLCTQPILLNNLKHLHLFIKSTHYNRNQSILSHFYNCPALIHLDLRYLAESQFEIEVEKFPRKIENIRLEGIKVNWAGLDENLSLKTLHLRDYSYNAAQQCYTEHIRANNLVLHCRRESTDFANFMNFLRNQTQFDNFHNIYVGPFYWDEQQFMMSGLANVVDKKMSFYNFQNGIGTGITETLFEQLGTF